MSEPGGGDRARFADHFAPVARLYERFRPTYPPDLFDFLAAAAPARHVAWDCATGSGQAARGLATRFARVVATDASAEQIAAAPPIDRVEFRVAPAEASGLDDASVELVTVAQALHWLPVDDFHREARRVLVAGGVIAEWTYRSLRVDDPAIDRLVDRFEHVTMGPWWPPERRLVDEQYASIPFPFARLDAPEIVLRARWTRDDLLGYVSSWSATARFRKARGSDPLTQLATDLAEVWPDDAARDVWWPVTVRVGRC